MGKKKQRQQDQPKGSRRDVLIVVAVMFAISLLIAAAIPVGCAASLMGGYHRFIQDLGSSLMYARENDSLEISVDGETRKADLAQAEVIYGLISDTGMGSPLSEAPDSEPLAFIFGDGSSLQLFSTRIDEPEGKQVDGLAICFQRKDGTTFAYDTDQLTYQDVVSRIQ